MTIVCCFWVFFYNLFINRNDLYDELHPQNISDAFAIKSANPGLPAKVGKTKNDPIKTTYGSSH